MANVNQLLEEMQEYYTALNRHLNILKEELQILENRWRAFNVVYEGEAAQQFQASWLQTWQWFGDYIDQMQRITALLLQRIEALESLSSVQI